MAKQPAGKNTPRQREQTKQQTQSAKAGKTDWVSKLDRWIYDHRSTLALGVLLILIGIGLFVAFISYLLHGPADQSVVRAAVNDSAQDAAPETKNWLGLVGASIAHVFVFRWFGVGALGLPVVVFLAGWKLTFGKELLPLARLTKGMLFFTIWTSLFIGYFVRITDSVSSASVWCGGVGYEVNQVMATLLGGGSIVLIGFMLFVFIIFYFDASSWSFTWKMNWPRLKPADTDDYDDDTLQDYEKEEEEEQPAPKPATNGKPATSPVAPVAVPPTPEPEPDVRPAPVAAPVVAAVASEPEPVVPADEPVRTSRIISFDDPPKNGKPVTATTSQGSDFVVKQPGETPESVAPAFDVPVGEASSDSLVAEHGPYDATLDLPHYQYPVVDLLTDYPSKGAQVSEVELTENKNRIEDTLLKFGIGIKKIFAEVGPTVTLYEIIPADGVRISKIKSLEDDIALSLSALGIRIIAPMPGKGTIGIEVPNKNREMVSMRSVILNEKFSKSNFELPVILGKTISNEIYIADLAKMPHLLMAGATGQGKSVGLNVLLTSLIYKKHPAHLKLVLVDPKKVELALYNKIERHFLAKLPDSEEAIITDTKKVVNTLNSLCVEMDNRYNLLKDAGVRNIKEYNTKFTNRKLNPEKGHRFMPYIVLIIDELADLMMTAGKEVEQPIARLAQLARAIGIHLVVATQRPSVNVITGLIKANFPARLSFKVTSKIDSRTILDTGGAEQLVGMGDMLLSSNSDLIRLQCPFVDTEEIDELCDFVSGQRGYDEAYALPEYVGDEGGQDIEEREIDLSNRDVMFDEAARLVVIHQQGSTSLIQRRLKLGYNRAGRLIDQLEAAGIVGPFEGSKAREVLVQDPQHLEEVLRKLRDQ
ncbi:DNA translocase FtsK [Arsenicibacter rosenii]|uniref:Cell division protein FtsK n=1 Tax=Arsenicibacter rosenii TaxID=1750698 RepID=A0A1S2VPL8_9BACT|nr:DNA translocase FtsK [Arsenicibacter rosenii]OIN60185.1 cell division protein FtsK [Arsenicibacter rosenii]